MLIHLKEIWYLLLYKLFAGGMVGVRFPFATVNDLIFTTNINKPNTFYTIETYYTKEIPYKSKYIEKPKDSTDVLIILEPETKDTCPLLYSNKKCFYILLTNDEKGYSYKRVIAENYNWLMDKEQTGVRLVLSSDNSKIIRFLLNNKFFYGIIAESRKADPKILKILDFVTIWLAFLFLFALSNALISKVRFWIGRTRKRRIAHRIMAYTYEDVKCLQTTECSVCLEKYKSDDIVKILDCNHLFHQDCIDKWIIDYSSCCPYCRNTIRE